MERDYLNNLNEEQRDYLKSNNNVLVSASAGTGKTSTMVVKLLDLVVDKKIPVNKLLVVTFTNAAAWEMKQRLLLALNKYLLTCGVDEKDFIIEQIEILTNCDIGTIHSICRKWIVKFFNDLKIDPSFSLLDENQSKYYLNVAIKNVFNKLIIEKDDKFYQLFISFNKTRDDSMLKEVILKVYNFLVSKINAKSWQREVVEKCCDKNISENICCNFIKEYVVEKLTEYKKMFEKIANEADVFGFEKYSMFAKNRLAYIDFICGGSDFLQVCENFLSFNLLNKPFVPKSEQNNIDLNLFDEEVTSINETFNKLKTELKQLLFDSDNLKNDLFIELDYLKGTIGAIFNLCEDVKNEYSKIKKQKNALDFNDIEYFAYKLISNNEILTQLKNNYDFIFIDEYQDVNELQEFILCSLENKNNLNMIGDVKQSIYAFRRSTPKIFIEKYNKFLKKNNGTVAYFNRNYRSDNNILQFVNNIFNELITTETIGIDYKKDSQLVSGFKDDTKKVVSMKLIDTKIEDDDEIVNLDKLEYVKKQCVVIAEHIASLIGKPYSIGDKTGIYTYKDIAILLRSKGTFLNELIKTLKLYNIPVSAKYKIQIFNEIEILYLLSVIKIIDNPFDDIALVTVMKGVLGEFDESELMLIAQAEGEFFYNKILAYSGDKNLEVKIKGFIEGITGLRFYFETHNLSDTINKIVYENGLMLYYKSLPNGFQREANIQEFIKLASVQAYSNSIYEFLNYIDSIKGNSYELTLNSSNNCVQIMTMHGSKGLGYPAVIIADIGSEFRVNHNTSECILNDEFGLGIQYKDLQKRTQKKSIIQNACLLKNKIDEINEEIRIFYVALTRAKNNLFLVGSYNFDKLRKKQFNKVYDCKSFLEMFLFANKGDNLNFFKNKKEKFTLNDGKESSADVEILQLEVNKEETIKKQPICLVEVINDEVEKNRLFLSTKLRNESNDAIVKKNTVSSLLAENRDYCLELDGFNLLSMADEINEENIATELGTLYHQIMEKIDYSENLDQVVNKVNNFINSSSLSKNILEEVDYNKIYKAVLTIRELLKQNCIIKKEQQFVMKVKHSEIVENSNINQKVIVQGVVDLIVINPNKTGYIIDFKTNKSVNAEYYAKHYKSQLFLYKLAVNKLFKEVDFKTYIYSFEAGKLLDI